MQTRRLLRQWREDRPRRWQLFLLRRLVASRSSAAIAAAARKERTACRLAARRRRRLTAKKTPGGNVRRDSVPRLCRLRCRQRVLWPLQRRLVTPLWRWMAVQLLCLLLRLVLAGLWCLGPRASSKSRPAS